MAQVINTTFQFKRGTAARWAEVNLILQAGEPGYAIDTGILKIGDGINPWNSLSAINENRIDEAQIQQAVEQYLEQHPINVVTDATLSVAGQAADAKAVRDNCVFNGDCLILRAGDADDNIF